MATITLTTDTLISALMPSGGGSLASGDTIQLDGHSLIVDADALAYPVSIANSAADANLELRDLGRIKLNATLPANVHPWIDPAHPLPVSDDAHAIDGDGYRTTLTANARAEIQLVGNFPLGGGAASLPTETRPGNFYAKVVSSPAANKLEFDRDIPLHAGDLMFFGKRWGEYHSVTGSYTISDYDPASKIATFSANVGDRSSGIYCGLVAGGVVVRVLYASSVNTRAISAPVSGGTFNVVFKGFGVVAARVCLARMGLVPDSQTDMYDFWHTGFVGALERLWVDQLVAEKIVHCRNDSDVYEQPPAYEYFGDICAALYMWNPSSSAKRIFAKSILMGGGFSGDNFHNCIPSLASCVLENFEVVQSFDLQHCESVHLKNSTVGGELVENTILEKSGTVSIAAGQGWPIPFAWFHAPATVDDTTWRYEDRIVKAHATLRIRALWKRAENSTANAAVAITNTANWYAGTQDVALAEAVFPASENDVWQESPMEWRNDSDEDAQVRVWETVTGDTAGGYLRTIAATGGPL